MKTGRAPSTTPRPPDYELFPALDRNWPAHGLGPVSALVAQLPDPADLAEGALVVVRDAEKPPRGLRRLARAIRSMWHKPPRAHPAVRCTALLARGYRDDGPPVGKFGSRGGYPMSRQIGDRQ